MNEAEALTKIRRMSIDEKIAALSPTDKAYIKGYVERAVLQSRKHKPKKNKEKLSPRCGESD